MTKDELIKTLDAINLALSASNNCIATDDVTAQPDETHWRIDHTEELSKMDKLRVYLLGSIIP